MFIFFFVSFQGSSGFANHIDTLMDLAEYFEVQIRERPEFMLVSPRQYMNVCFWYLPRYLQGRQNVLDYGAQLHKVRRRKAGGITSHSLSYSQLITCDNTSSIRESLNR